MQRVVDGKRYDTRTATLIARAEYWDGHNMDRGGRNTYLYRTLRGRYFTVITACWQGEMDMLTPISEREAVELYTYALLEHRVDFEAAFPNVTVEDA